MAQARNTNPSFCVVDHGTFQHQSSHHVVPTDVPLHFTYSSNLQGPFCDPNHYNAMWCDKGAFPSLPPSVPLNHARPGSAFRGPWRPALPLTPAPRPSQNQLLAKQLEALDLHLQSQPQETFCVEPQPQLGTGLILHISAYVIHVVAFALAETDATCV